MAQMLKVGVVGAGNIATIAQLPTLASRPDVALTALVDTRADTEPLRRRWGFDSVHRSVEEMVAAHELDAVFVLTPRDTHAGLVESVLRAGIDVYCEKPLAATAADARHLADLAEETGRLLMVDFNRRFAPVYAAGREVFASQGATFCAAQKNRCGSEYRATFENAIHMVDLLRWYCGGTPVEVVAHSAGEDPWEEDGVAALVRFDNGNTGVLVAARTAGAWAEKLDAYGGGRSVEICAPDQVRMTADGVTQVREMSPEALGWATATQTMGFAAGVHHFLQCVVDRSQPMTNGREAARTQDLLERILVAAGLPTEEMPGRAWVSHAQ